MSPAEKDICEKQRVKLVVTFRRIFSSDLPKKVRLVGAAPCRRQLSRVCTTSFAWTANYMEGLVASTTLSSFWGFLVQIVQVWEEWLVLFPARVRHHNQKARHIFMFLRARSRRPRQGTATSQCGSHSPITFTWKFSTWTRPQHLHQGRVFRRHRHLQQSKKPKTTCTMTAHRSRTSHMEESGVSDVLLAHVVQPSSDLLPASQIFWGFRQGRSLGKGLWKARTDPARKHMTCLHMVVSQIRLSVPQPCVIGISKPHPCELPQFAIKPGERLCERSQEDEDYHLL